jgi:hypothetical protein
MFNQSLQASNQEQLEDKPNINTQKFKTKYKNLENSSLYQNEYVQKVLKEANKSNPFTKNGNSKYSEEQFYNAISKSTSFLDKNGVMKNEIDKYYKEYTDNHNMEDDKKGFTIFMFISETTPVEQIKQFSISIEKLKKLNSGIKGLVMTRGLVGGTFDSMARYVRGFKQSGVEKLEVTFHPWAFKYFKLDRVPAYALSYCDANNFRFKNCDHKYLIKGEMNLRSFFEYIMEDDKEYSKYFYELIEN